MVPLGLSKPDRRAYLSTLLSSHNFTVTADVCGMNGKPIESIRETLLDGQVNIQRDGPVRRTATMTFLDPAGRLGLDDPDSPFVARLFVDRMVRITHTLIVPGVGRCPVVTFLGPIVKVSRDGDTVSVECQDKAALAARGRPPVTVRKGADALAAIRKIMGAVGETRFRFQVKSRKLAKSYSVGWSDEASPWVVASQIARYLGAQMLYSADGWLVVRRIPRSTAIALTGAHVTEDLKTDYDATEVINTVRVTGTLKPKKKSQSDKKDKKKADAKPVKVATTAVLRPRNPVSPVALAVNGSLRYLPLLIEGGEFRTQAAAVALANDRLRGAQSFSASASFSCVPLFHLDADDLIRVSALGTTAAVRFSEGSIPLGVGGDMSVGTQREVAGRPPRRRRRRG